MWHMKKKKNYKWTNITQQKCVIDTEKKDEMGLRDGWTGEEVQNSTYRINESWRWKYMVGIQAIIMHCLPMMTKVVKGTNYLL